jgi:gamma-glutamylcyclotransferase (GGCT)/AIG2-like uncharacterized protein YtfP
MFVYGTLKPSECHADIWLERAIATQPAIVSGQLYALPLGYPALVPGTQWVEGYLLSFADAVILTLLDELEQHGVAEFQQQYPGLVREEYAYTRNLIAVFDRDQRLLNQAWVYQMTHEQVARLRGAPLPEGRWSHQIQTQVFRCY